MTLLYDPPQAEDAPTARDIFWTWVVWLPIAAASFYVAWGYATARDDGDIVSLGVEAVLALLGVGAVIRSGARTRRWLKGVETEEQVP